MAKCVSRCASAAPCVFGPVLARAFTRLGLILRSLVKPHFFLGRRSLDHLNSAPSISCTLRRSVSPRSTRRRSISFRLAFDGFRRWSLGDRSARYIFGECIGHEGAMLTPPSVRSS
jgi:hypothetical protein